MYYVVFGIFWLVSLLPLGVLYRLSDGVFFLLFYVFQYRKKIVLQNLKQAFPDKTQKERNRIARKFYRNLTDSIMETIKMFSVDKHFINRHCSGDYSVFERLYQEKKSCQVHPSHQFNWEWLNHHFSMHIKQTMLAVYMPLTNPLFEKIFYKQRTKWGSVLLSAKNMKESFRPWQQRLHALVLVADQNPGDPRNAYWIPFFNKPTPFLKGPEKAAREKKCPVVFAFFQKKRRGYYHIEFILAAENAAMLQEGELTKMYAHHLSQKIMEQPELWLWSHRRWKWDWKPEYGELLK